MIKGKAEYGGGWLCFAKKGGCGHKWPDGADVIERQEVGEIDNPEIPDTWNTVVKMAEKRARVDAVLAVTGASALFTQDVEDNAPAPEQVVPVSSPPASPAQLAKVKEALSFLLPPGPDTAAFIAVGEACGKSNPITVEVAKAVVAAIKARKDFEEEQAIVEEQDSSAEQPDPPSPDDPAPGQAQVPTDAPPPDDSGTAAQLAPDQGPVEGIEDEMPADKAGLD